jgi:glucose/arabinose dehydrogenase
VRLYYAGVARRGRQLLLSSPTLLLLALVLVGGGGTAAVGCKLAWNCRARDIPLIGGMFRRGEFAGLEKRGTGQTMLPRGFVQKVVVSGLKLPTAFTRLPDGRLLVAEKSGIVKLVRVGGGEPRVILDLRREVNDWSDHGLLDIKASPDFRRTGRIYLLYTHDDPQDSSDGHGNRTARVTRMTMTGNSISTKSEKVIVGSISEGSCNDHPSGSDCLPADGAHSGGALRFAPDGNLFISTGDGSGNEKLYIKNELRAQDLGSLSGKVLRVTREGKGLPSNPFWTGNPNAARSRVWAYGLRNPFRFDIRPGTNQLYIGDVGFSLWDEVDVVDKPGLNLGWPCYEGNIRSPQWKRQPVCRRLYAQGKGGVTFPLVAYPGSTVVGGTFYTGRTWPSEFRGAYLFGDWEQSWIKYLTRGSKNTYAAKPRDLAAQAAGPVELDFGPDGDLYYVALNIGQIRRISFHGG